jgi:hypothetical protein
MSPSHSARDRIARCPRPPVAVSRSEGPGVADYPGTRSVTQACSSHIGKSFSNRSRWGWNRFAVSRVVHPQQQRLEPVFVEHTVAVHHRHKVDLAPWCGAAPSVSPADAAVHRAREELLPLVAQQVLPWGSVPWPAALQELHEPPARGIVTAIVHDNERRPGASLAKRDETALHVLWALCTGTTIATRNAASTSVGTIT